MCWCPAARVSAAAARRSFVTGGGGVRKMSAVAARRRRSAGENLKRRQESAYGNVNKMASSGDGMKMLEISLCDGYICQFDVKTR